MFAIDFLSCNSFSSSTKIIAFAVLHLLENSGPIIFQNFLLCVTFLTSMLLKYCFLVLRKRLTQILRFFLYFSKLIAVLSKFYLLFNVDHLIITDFVKVLFVKELLLYLKYFSFKGANFSRVKVSEYPFKEKRNTVKNIVLLYTHFYNIYLNVLRPNFFNIFNLPISNFPNIKKIRVKVGPKTNYFSYFMSSCTDRIVVFNNFFSFMFSEPRVKQNRARDFLFFQLFFE